MIKVCRFFVMLACSCARRQLNDFAFGAEISCEHCLVLVVAFLRPSQRIVIAVIFSSCVHWQHKNTEVYLIGNHKLIDSRVCTL